MTTRNLRKSPLAALALTAVLGAALTACGSSDDEADGMSLVKDGTLTVCSDVPYAPFEDFDKSSPLGYTGFDVDIVAAIAEKIDLELVIKDSGFDGLESGLEMNSGKCDLAASAMTITPEREKNIGFSDSYYDSKQSLLVPVGSDITSLADLDGRKLGVQASTTGSDYAKENAKGAEIVEYEDDALEFSALKAGNVAALLQDLPVNLEHTKDGKYTVVETFETDEQYGFGMDKDDTELIKQVNEALAELKESGEYQKIYDTYFKE